MLFKSLFNWIKYKTLPPSILFKNRLFIERDVKHRRIQTVLGLTFRNSKWSSYSRPNLSVKLTEDYTRLVKVVLLSMGFLFVLFFFTSFYSTSTTLNLLSSFFWFFADCVTFSYFFLYFTLGLLFQTLLTKVYTTMWLTQLPSTSSSAKQPQASTSEAAYVPKHLQKYTLYSYLKHSSLQSCDIATFFPSNAKQVKQDSTFLKSFYTVVKVARDLGQGSTNVSLTNLLHLDSTSTASNTVKLGLWVSNNAATTAHTHLLLNYLVQQRSATPRTRMFHESSSTLPSLTRWNLYHIAPETKRRGNFYATTTNLNILNRFSASAKHTLTWFSAMQETVRSIKSQYWLYRYSVLHRSVFKNNHTLTVTKRLLGSGFFDSKILKGNLWASNNLSLASEYSNFSAKNKSTMELLYNNSKKVQNVLVEQNFTSTPSRTLSSLGMYQKSFDWFLTRAYHFNGLQNASLVSSYKLTSAVEESSSVTGSQEQLRFLLTSSLQTLALSNNIHMGQINAPTWTLSRGLLNFLESGDTVFNPNQRDLYLFYSSQAAYNSTILHHITTLLQNNTVQGKQVCYQPVTGSFNEPVFNTFTLNVTLPTKSKEGLNGFFSSRVVLLEALILQDLASYATYIQK